MTEKNFYAFPRPIGDVGSECLYYNEAQTGMTFRDYVAVSAMHGLLSNSAIQKNNDHLADEAYKIADEMLAAREAENHD